MLNRNLVGVGEPSACVCVILSRRARQRDENATGKRAERMSRI